MSRCYICDAQLSDEEIKWNNKHKDWDPCNTCKEVIRDAVNEDSDSESVPEPAEAIEAIDYLRIGSFE